MAALGIVLVLLLVIPAAGQDSHAFGQRVVPTVGPTDDVAAPTEEPVPTDEPGPAAASVAFSVAVCPAGVTAFPDVLQADGLPDCQGTGAAGGEPPLAGGIVTLVNVDTGETLLLTLDGSGYAEVPVAGGSPYVATFALNGSPLQSRSVCGSSLSGLAGAIEQGILIAEGEALSCQVLTLSLAAAPPAPAGGTIALALGSCPSTMADDTTLLTGDGVLDCNGDPAVDESEPLAGATVTFTNLTTGASVSDVTDKSGTSVSGTVPAGPYVAAVTVDGAEVAWASVCGGSDASGAPLGLVGPIDNPAAPLVLSDGDALTCRGLVIVSSPPMPPTPAPTSTVTLSLTVRDCPSDFDWGPVISAGPPTAAAIQAVQDHYAATCLGEGSVPVTTWWRDIMTGEEGPKSDVLLSSAFETQAMPGQQVVIANPDPTLDFWADCSVEGVYNRSGGNHVDPVTPPAATSLTIPPDFTGGMISCTVYLNHAAGTITHVVHGCGGFTIDEATLTCNPAPLPPQQFDAGAIWTSLPMDTSAWGSGDRVYAGPRWYLRNGFNRPWATGTSADGALTLTGSVPLTTVEIGVGNVNQYEAEAITVYCGSPTAGWTLVPVVPIDGKSPAIQWGDGLVPVGIDGAPAQVTCHWFVDATRFAAP